jgi:hypothetical protein
VNEISIEVIQAWVVIVAVSAVLLTVLGVFVLALMGFGKARKVLIDLALYAKQIEQYVDEPDDALIKQFVGLAQLLNLNLKPEDAAQLLPRLIELLGTLGDNNGEANVISKAD